MKTQEEYALEIDEIVRRDVESRQSDWFKIDKEIFMQPENKNKAFILGTRKTGCDLIILGGTNCDEGSMDWLFWMLVMPHGFTSPAAATTASTIWGSTYAIVDQNIR